MRISPVVPSRVIPAPSGIREVASRTLITAGRPYSRAVVAAWWNNAAWVRTMPPSVGKSGVQAAPACSAMRISLGPMSGCFQGRLVFLTRNIPPAGAPAPPMRRILNLSVVQHAPAAACPALTPQPTQRVFHGRMGATPATVCPVTTRVAPAPYTAHSTDGSSVDGSTTARD